METHPLNLAHQQHRRAEAHLKQHRYDDAMKCHHNAAELLLDAMKSTTSSVALESITLQHSYHLKQKDLIKIKKDQYARVKTAMDKFKQLGKEPIIQTNDNSKLQVAIYRTLHEADSLLDVLTMNKSIIEVSPEKATTDVSEGKVIAKTPETVVEELQTLNHSLHGLVEKLVLQVEVLKDENKTLKEKVHYLEKERTKYLNIQANEMLQQNFTNLSVGNDSLVNNTHNRNLPTTLGYGAGYTRPVQQIQQPHFDLSAFKDD